MFEEVANDLDTVIMTGGLDRIEFMKTRRRRNPIIAFARTVTFSTSLC